jgi:hypothetical protein
VSARAARWLALGLACALLAVPGRVAPCAAQEEGVPVADRTIVQLSAGARVPRAAPVLDVAVGRFVGDRVQLGIRQEVGFATGSGAHDWHLATTPFADVFLAADPKWLLTPFVGVAAGALYDDRRLTATVGPEAGVAVFLSDDVLVSARYQFRWAAERVGGIGHDSHLAMLGVGFVFGGADEDLARAEASAARAEDAAAKAEAAVTRLEEAVGRLERAVDDFARWYKEQLRK